MSISVENLAQHQPLVPDFSLGETPAPRPARARARWLILAALTVIAAWLRFTSTGFGLPDKFRPDEEYLLSRALGFENDWNPHFAIYPAAQMYVQHAALKYYAALIGERQNFRAAYATDGQALAYRVARGVSAAFGTATVPALYFAAAPVFGPGAALAASAIATFATLPVRESKYATTDAATMFWLTLAFAMILRIAKRGAHGTILALDFSPVWPPPPNIRRERWSSRLRPRTLVSAAANGARCGRPSVTPESIWPRAPPLSPSFAPRPT